VSLSDHTITIVQRYRGGWSYEAWFEPELFAPPIQARGRGRNEREAIGDLVYQAQRELNISVGVLGQKRRASRRMTA